MQESWLRYLFGGGVYGEYVQEEDVGELAADAAPLQVGVDASATLYLQYN